MKETGILIFLFGLVPAVLVAQPMSGTYPVGPGGPGVDSFATVQEAANALSSRGLAGDVDFPIATGTYTGPVLVRNVANSGNFSSRFHSPLLISTIDAGGARRAFEVESTHNVTLQRLRFRGARDSGSACVRFADSHHGRVRSGRVGDSADVGILLERCDSMRLDSVRVEGDLAGPGSRGMELRDCRFTGVYRCSMPGTVGTGMLVSGGGQAAVYRMTVMNPLVHGLKVENSTGDSFSRVFNRGAPEFGIHAVRSTGMHFDSCTSTGATSAGVYFEECDSLEYEIPMIVTAAPRAFWLSRSEDCVVRVLSIMGQPAVAMFFDRSPRCAVESTQAIGVLADTGFALMVDSSPNSSFTFAQMAGSFRRGVVIKRSDGVRLRHVRVRGTVSEAALSIENSNRVKVQTCSLGTVTGIAGAAAVTLAGECVDDSLMEMTVLTEAEHGIHLQGAGVRHTVLANSFLYGWTGNGVYLDGTGSPRLYYNTIVSREEAGVAGVRFRGVAGAEAKDNIVHNRGLDSSYCYRADGGFPFVVSDYNDLYASGSGGGIARVGDTVFAGLDDWRAHGSAPDGHSIDRDPLFEVPGDFHLAETSPCRDAGIPVAGIARDLDGNGRDPVTPDIGADEFGGGAISEHGRRRPEPALSLRGNPVGDFCRVSYTLARDENVSLRLLDVAGRVIRTLTPGLRPAGTHAATLRLDGLSSGIYLIELKTGTSSTSIRKLVKR